MKTVKFFFSFFIGLFFGAIPFYFLLFPFLRKLIMFELFDEGDVRNNLIIGLFIGLFFFGGFIISLSIFLFLRKTKTLVAWGCLTGGALATLSFLFWYLGVVLTVS